MNPTLITILVLLALGLVHLPKHKAPHCPPSATAQGGEGGVDPPEGEEP